MKRILIIDDEEEFCSLIKEILEISGDYEVLVATDGKSGIRVACEQNPDLVLLDIIMPVMDGFEVLGALKRDERFQTTPIIFITSLDRTEDKVRGFHSGAVDYIAKPISVEEVKARVRAHLSLREAEEQRTRAKQLQAVKDMIVTYNHEMNQPLTVILGDLKLLMDGVDKNSEQRKMFELIEEQVGKVLKILGKIRSIDSVKEKEYVGTTRMLDLDADSPKKD